jgi:hypothetical protein
LAPDSDQFGPTLDVAKELQRIPSIGLSREATAALGFNASLSNIRSDLVAVGAPAS